jgi:hypothetical protein
VDIFKDRSAPSLPKRERRSCASELKLTYQRTNPRRRQGQALPALGQVILLLSPIILHRLRHPHPWAILIPLLDRPSEALYPQPLHPCSLRHPLMHRPPNTRLISIPIKQIRAYAHPLKTPHSRELPVQKQNLSLTNMILMSLGGDRCLTLNEDELESTPSALLFGHDGRDKISFEYRLRAYATPQLCCGHLARRLP